MCPAACVRRKKKEETMNPIELLKNGFDSFTKSEQKAAAYILNDPKVVLAESLSIIAKKSGSSNAALVRLCQKLGFRGFSEFQFSMHRALISHETDPDGARIDSMQGILNLYTQYINQLPSFVSQQELARMAQAICEANRISIWGVNRTGQSARQLSNRLGRLGLFNKVTEDFVVMHDDANCLHKGDLCILFTMFGRGRKDYDQMMALLQERGCHTVLVTMNPRLPSARYADQVIALPCISRASATNFFEDQIIVYLFIELLLYEVANTYIEKE